MSKYGLIHFVAPILVIGLLTGCTGISYQGGDALKTIYSNHVGELKSKYSSPGSLAKAITYAEEDRDPNGIALSPSGTARNALLNDFIFLIDSNYTFYEKHLYNKKAYSDFAADVSSATLSTVSGIVTGGGAQGAKSILSFVAGGITSTKASIDKDILQSQNLLAIAAKMRAQRAAQLLVIQAGMYKTKSTTPTSIDQYSVNQGLVDLATYYQAGTFVSALQAIIDTAGKEKTDSDEKINGLKGIQQKLKNIPSLDDGLGTAAPAGRPSASPATFVSASTTSSSAPTP